MNSIWDNLDDYYPKNGTNRVNNADIIFQIHRGVIYGVKAAMNEALISQQMRREMVTKPNGAPYALWMCRYSGCQHMQSNKSTLRFHVISHLNLRPFKCSYCPECYNHPGTLLNHFKNKHAFLG